MGKILPLCANCGQSVKRSDKKYCSKECYNLSRSINISKSDLLDIYITKNFSRKKTCEHFNCTLSYLNSKIKEFNIPSKNLGVDFTKSKFKSGKILSKTTKNCSNNLNRWIVQCECGKKFTTNSRKLNKLNKISCRICNNTIKRQDIILPVYIYTRIKTNAEKRNYSWEISREDLEFLLIKQNFKCALSGVDIIIATKATNDKRGQTTISLDRKDSSIGYTIDNIQWVHKRINLMKNKFPDKEFLEWCSIISDYQTSIKSS